MKTKRQIRKKATLLRKKAERKIKREDKKFRKQIYKDFVKEIKERDNYTCQISGKYLKDSKPQSLQVVHILSKENYPEFMLDPINVICLSFYHHKNSPLSPHLDGFAFVEFFKNKFPDRYTYLINKLREK